MPNDTPLSQLILWVPPALAAAWERLPPDQQAAQTQAFQAWLTARLLPPPRWSPSLEEIEQMSFQQLRAFVEDLERKFRLQAEEGMP